MVLDEVGEGIPAEWLQSNNDATVHMRLFFEFIKNCRVLTPHWLMSDMANQFYNVWVAVMGGEPKNLFWTGMWTKPGLRVKVKDTVVAGEIYKMVRIVMQQTDIESFYNYFAHFNERLTELSQECAKYFQHEWIVKRECGHTVS